MLFSAEMDFQRFTILRNLLHTAYRLEFRKGLDLALHYAVPRCVSWLRELPWKTVKSVAESSILPHSVEDVPQFQFQLTPSN